MILVFYILLGIIGLIVLLILAVIFSKLEFKIQNLDMSNVNKELNNNKIQVSISLKLGKLHWIRVNFDKDKIIIINKKIKRYEQRNKVKTEKMRQMAKEEIKIVLKNPEIRRLIKNTKIELEEFKTNISIGTEDYVITSYLVGIISAIIPNILARATFGKKQKISKTVIFRVQPIYQPKNIYAIKMNMKISTKVSHLLYIAIMLVKQTNKIRKLNENNRQTENYNTVKKDKMENIEKRNATAV